jgi:hypothetical protein
MDMDEA